MKTLKVKCPNCKKVREVPYKKRNRPGFCSLRCAYDFRTIYPKKKKCWYCKKLYERKGAGGKYCSYECAAKGYIGFRHSDKTKRKMKKAWTAERKNAQTIPMRYQKCSRCRGKFLVKERGKGSIRKFCSEKCYQKHLQEDNHMKRPELRARMSEVARTRSPETSKKIGEGISKAWKDGKFDGAAVGQCKWFTYKKLDGTTCKAQGYWELAFCDWLDKNGLKFTAHRGWIPYTLKGKKRNWYPDFWVNKWKCWVDVKCEYFYLPEKFKAIRRCNPDKTVKLLFLEDLTKLGVKIYDKGSCYHEDLQDLARRSGL